MKLKFLSTILPTQEGEAKTADISCAPNATKSAIACADRSVILIDENGEQRDKFSCKPHDAKFGKKSFNVLSIAFSPDSSKLAVGQSDNVLFVYKIGTTWNEKKVIVNKFPQTSSVLRVVWPFDDKIIIGLLDGKVRVGLTKNNKCSSLFKTDQAVVSMQVHPKRVSLITGHQDGSIVLYNFSSRTHNVICTLQSPPYTMCFTTHGVIIAGADRRIFCYSENGVLQQQFDYSEEEEKEFSSIICDKTAENVVVASYDRLRLFSWSMRRGAWDEGAPLEVKNSYSFTTLGWKSDGSTIYAGTLTGGVIAVDCCLKRGMLKSKFETTFVAPSHVIVRDVVHDTRTNLISNKGLSIDDMKIMGRDRFIVGYTSSTIIIADTETQRFSELEWQSGGHEKFYFEFANACLIINAGEITVVEYGIDGALGWVRTELTSPHLLSLRITENQDSNKNAKKLAYLVDPTTIAILNLMTNNQECLINHVNAIDWIELNESVTKLLFRDKRSKVTLVDIASDNRTVLLSFCTYVQWVPLSDVIVAQNADNLSIWYNPDLPEQVATLKIKGEVESVLRDDDRTEVIVQEANAKVAYELDRTQIEFGSALEKLDFDRAVMFLETNSGSDQYHMWQRVAELALEHQQLFIAQRCYAAIKDVPRAKRIFEIIEMADEYEQTQNADGLQYYKVRAELARMSRKYKEAERIYVEENDLDSAITMYKTLHQWDEAMELAKATNYSGYEQLKSSYLRSLGSTGQDSKAAEIKISEGDPEAAVKLFLKGNKPIAALNIVMDNPKLTDDENLLFTIAEALLKSQFYEQAGDVYEKMKKFNEALDFYTKGHAFAKAIKLCRFAFPEKVVEMEDQWGDHLNSIGQHEAAINHFLEANKSQKAVDSAIRAKEWSKIVDIIQDQSLSRDYYGKIADHYASVGEFDRAERLFIEADLQKQAISMYIKNNKWTDAYRLSEEFLGKEETIAMYTQKAEELEDQGRFAEAEQLYISIGQSARAIQMYKNAGRDDEVFRLVEKYHTEQLQETHKHFGMEYEERGDMKAAEEEYLKAGDWKAAANMYRESEMWSDAHRIIKIHGNAEAQKQIVFMWAKSLGGDAAVKLLSKNGMLDDAIQFAVQSGSFDFALDLAKLGDKEKLKRVHIQMAQYLEGENRLDEAAIHYVEAGLVNEAVQMYIHDQDWAAAEKYASDDQKLLETVYSAQAQLAIDEGDLVRAESLYLRANQPKSILKYYSDNHMWPDALRITKEYLPYLTDQIHQEIEKSEILSGARGVDSYIAQAEDWQTQSEWEKAVMSYLKVTPDVTENEGIVADCADKAADLTTKFLLGNEKIVSDVLSHLQECQRHSKAAELLLNLGQTKQAIKALCSAKDWGNAKQIAQEYMPEMIPEIEESYKESLKTDGRLGDLINVDVVTAIDILIERDQWDKALETAKHQNNRPLMDKYVAKYVAILLQDNDISRIIAIYEKYGASGGSANISIHMRILQEVLKDHTISFDTISRVRNILLDALKNQKTDDGSKDTFENFMLAAHFYSMRVALELCDHEDTTLLKMKISLSLLRYANYVPPDRVFYEAGIAAKEYGGKYENLGFLLLNNYLDLVDAFEEGNADLVDFSAFEGTDIPTDIQLPTRQWLDPQTHEEIKEWVLAVSVDDDKEKELVIDEERGLFEASLTDNESIKSDMCVITGYPIHHRVQLGQMAAEKEDFNKFLIIMKSHPTDELINCQNFLSLLTGGSLSLAIRG